MRTLMTIVGALLVLMGGVWILQGINVLPGSFMTGQTRWTIYGALTALAGIALIVMARRGAP
jgi:drug/metabolite transporter superfamily protein YnfA